MKKISLLTIAIFVALFTAYKSFDDLVKSIESWDIEWDEEEDLEGF